MLTAGEIILKNQYIKSLKVEKQIIDKKPVNVYIVNDRYEIHSDIGVCYDTIKGKDLPLYIFQLRDALLQGVEKKL
jgi:hypothetical protein